FLLAACLSFLDRPQPALPGFFQQRAELAMVERPEAFPLEVAEQGRPGRVVPPLEPFRDPAHQPPGLLQPLEVGRLPPLQLPLLPLPLQTLPLGLRQPQPLFFLPPRPLHRLLPQSLFLLA